MFWNRAAETVFGYPSAGVMGKSAAFLFPPESQPEQALARGMRQAREHGKASDNCWLLARDGRRLWAEGVLTVLEADEGGRGKSVSGAITAVDGRKLTLDSGLVLVVPPTLSVDQNILRVGTRIAARYEDQGGAHVVTTIRREPS